MHFKICNIQVFAVNVYPLKKMNYAISTWSSIYDIRLGEQLLNVTFFATLNLEDRSTLFPKIMPNLCRPIDMSVYNIQKNTIH